MISDGRDWRSEARGLCLRVYPVLWQDKRWGVLSKTSVSRSGGQSRHGGHCGPPRPVEPRCAVPRAAEGAGTLCPAHLPTPPAPGGHHRYGLPPLCPSICLLVQQPFAYLSWFRALLLFYLHHYLLPFLDPSPLGILQCLVHCFHCPHFSED